MNFFSAFGFQQKMIIKIKLFSRALLYGIDVNFEVTLLKLLFYHQMKSRFAFAFTKFTFLAFLLNVIHL